MTRPAIRRRRSARVLVGIVIVTALSCGDGTGPTVRGEPRFITSDIPRFWAAFDQMTSASDTLPLRRGYLDGGSAGLTDFTNARWKNARTLAAMVWPLREYYLSVRSSTLSVAALEPEFRAVYESLKALHADAVLPDVYFAIGGMSTGGTISQRGLLIGTEMFSRTDDSPLEALAPWHRSVVRSSDILPAIVAHELTHFQQEYGSDRSLLAQSIREGSADFVSRLLTGRTINESLEDYGLQHEAAIWSEFAAVMHGTNVSRWLYNGGSVTDTTTRPADLGYFVGARITEAYFERFEDPAEALLHVMTIADFPEFLAESGYAGRFGSGAALSGAIDR